MDNDIVADAVINNRCKLSKINGKKDGRCWL